MYDKTRYGENRTLFRFVTYYQTNPFELEEKLSDFSVFN